MTDHLPVPAQTPLDAQRFAKPSKLMHRLRSVAPRLAQKTSLALAGSAITAKSLAVGLPLFTYGGVKVLGQTLGKTGGLTHKADQKIVDIADSWIAVNNRLIDRLLPKKDWQINVPNDLSPHKKYLLICNHQSWVDTTLIQYVSEGVLPLTRFFIKQELIYIPVVGQAFYLLDFPMMKRYSKEKIAKNPALAGKDLAEAKRACALLLDKEFVLLNYLEGTRFNTKKHTAQKSPYRHLLKPKAGGFALALASLGDEIDGILDMTIVYPDGVPDYAELWSGKMPRLSVDIRHAVMDDALLTALKQGEYQTTPAIKDALHAWLDKVWQEKDERITQCLKAFNNNQ